MKQNKFGKFYSTLLLVSKFLAFSTTFKSHYFIHSSELPEPIPTTTLVVSLFFSILSANVSPEWPLTFGFCRSHFTYTFIYPMRGADHRPSRHFCLITTKYLVKGEGIRVVL
jgi:hypothetical protein